ncbi:hypothetical protein JW911_01025 [Candidatus Peregrinibacteria bacterium]|nr:hypothetical protein [Candidatus Peregrinibacteria bacterium]
MKLGESLKRGYILAKNKIIPPKAKLAALKFGKVLRQRQIFRDGMEEVLSQLKKPYLDQAEHLALKLALKKYKRTGRRVTTGQDGNIFTPGAPSLLEPIILEPDVSDPRDFDEIRERYPDIPYPAEWKKTPDSGYYYAEVFDIADGVREAVARIAKEFGVHFASHHGTFGSEGHFLDRFTVPAHLNRGKFGYGGYCGWAYVSFADDPQVLIDAYKYFSYSLEEEETEKK